VSARCVSFVAEIGPASVKRLTGKGFQRSSVSFSFGAHAASGNNTTADENEKSNKCRLSATGTQARKPRQMKPAKVLATDNLALATNTRDICDCLRSANFRCFSTKCCAAHSSIIELSNAAANIPESQR
jgi:hypothetical protein